MRYEICDSHSFNISDFSKFSIFCPSPFNFRITSVYLRLTSSSEFLISVHPPAPLSKGDWRLITAVLIL